MSYERKTETVIAIDNTSLFQLNQMWWRIYIQHRCF